MDAEAHGCRILARLAPLVLALAVACAQAPGLRVASTTSIVDTGLADGLARRFLAATGVRMRIQAVGSGQAFALGRRGEADLVLAHDPEALARFEADGFVAAARPFARNDFVLAGPPSDPARAGQAADLVDAFRRIAAAGAPFVSRGDGSGTNARELAVWRATGRGGEPTERWYVKTGQGMAETLRVADERGGYVLTDSATFAVLERTLHLRVLVDRGPLRDNVYVAVAVRFRGRTPRDALRFLDFLGRPETRRYVLDLRGPGGRPLYRAP